jgi:ATP-dependent Lon protease
MNIKSIPVLPLRDIVVFPGMVAPLFVGRKQSVNALNHVMTGDKKIFLLAQKNSEVENPNKNDLYRCGTIAKFLQLLKLPDGTIKVLVEGIERANLKNLNSYKEFTSANVVKVEKKIKITNNIKALCKIVVEQFD